MAVVGEHPHLTSPAARQKISWHAAWAMAVGGMIGGGIYTLAGVILGVAGPLAWVSLAVGAVIALATVRSYVALTFEVRQEGVPVALLLKRGRYATASVLAWWLLLVYVLATAVYAYTFGQYVGNALGASPEVTAALVVGVVALLALLNLVGIHEPAEVQIVAVWIELVVLVALAVVGFVRWNPANVVAGVPRGSVGGVVSGMAATFIAFEGFEMLTYDVRELHHPRHALKQAVPAAVVSVAITYSLVTVGAASLVGADELVRHKGNALAVAGERAAGTLGLLVITVAACSSAASAINATLFSVARLARSAAEGRLVPRVLARSNARGCPHWAVLVLGAAAAILASVSSLEPLVQAASLAFLILFALVNALAFHDSGRKSVIAAFGALGATVAAWVVGVRLAGTHPKTLGGFVLAFAASVGAHMMTERRRRQRGEPGPESDPTVQHHRDDAIRALRDSQPDLQGEDDEDDTARLPP